MTSSAPSNISQKNEESDHPKPAGGNSDEEYPVQMHAGAVGLGPEYGKGAKTEDKMAGWKEELEGKILRKPKLVQHGHDLRTGELKKREMADDDNPFEKQDKGTLKKEGTPKGDHKQTTANPPSV